MFQDSLVILSYFSQTLENLKKSWVASGKGLCMGKKIILLNVYLYSEAMAQ